MAFFDYGAAAELFPSRQRTRTMGAVTYMRFAAAAEAIRYAVEEIPANSFRGAFLEVNEERFDSNEIRRLYESVEYPLPRQPAAIRDRLLSVRRASWSGLARHKYKLSKIKCPRTRKNASEPIGCRRTGRSNWQ